MIKHKFYYEKQNKVKVRVSFISFYSELAPTDSWSKIHQTLLGQKKNEEEISDELPHINDSILKLMATVGNRIISKKPWNFNFMLEYHITILLQQFTKTLNQLLILSRKYFLWMML